MASFERKCRKCNGRGTIAGATCETCHGSGDIVVPVKIPVNIAVDNRAPKRFEMAIHKDGTITFRENGRRSLIQTSAQSAFNRARQESAAEAIRDRQQTRKVKRGLLSLGKGR
jgi:RecJ-like exonuclease